MNNEPRPTLNLPEGIDPTAWISEVLGLAGTIGGAALGGPLGAGVGGAGLTALGSFLEQKLRDGSVDSDKLLREAILSGVTGALFTGGAKAAGVGRSQAGKRTYIQPGFQASNTKYVGGKYAPSNAKYVGSKFKPTESIYQGGKYMPPNTTYVGGKYVPDAPKQFVGSKFKPTEVRDEMLDKYLKLNQKGFIGKEALPKEPILRGTSKLTEKDIIETLPNIKLRAPVTAKTVAGEKAVINKGEALTPYVVKGNNVLLQDGKAYLVSKNQFTNIKNNAISAEVTPFIPGQSEIRKIVKGYNYKLDEEAKRLNLTLVNTGDTEFPRYKVMNNRTGVLYDVSSDAISGKKYEKLRNLYRLTLDNKAAYPSHVSPLRPDSKNVPYQYSEIILSPKNPVKEFNLPARTSEKLENRIRSLADDAISPRKTMSDKELEGKLKALYSYQTRAKYPTQHFGKTSYAHTRMRSFEVPELGNAKVVRSEESQSDIIKAIRRSGEAQPGRMQTEYANIKAKRDVINSKIRRMQRIQDNIREYGAFTKSERDLPKALRRGDLKDFQSGLTKRQEDFLTEEYRRLYPNEYRTKIATREKLSGDTWSDSFPKDELARRDELARKINPMIEKLRKTSRGIDIQMQKNPPKEPVIVPTRAKNWKDDIVRTEIQEAVNRDADYYTFTSALTQQRRYNLIDEFGQMTVKQVSPTQKELILNGTFENQTFGKLLYDTNTGKVIKTTFDRLGNQSVKSANVKELFSKDMLNAIDKYTGKTIYQTGKNVPNTKNKIPVNFDIKIGNSWADDWYDNMKVNQVQKIFGTRPQRLNIAGQRDELDFAWKITPSVKDTVKGKAPIIKTSGKKFIEDLPAFPDGIQPTLRGM